MKHEYKIYYNKEIVGTATIEPDGLYYQIDCTCHYTTNEIHRVFLKTLESEINLGVCAPEGEVAKTKSKIAAKLIDMNNLHFHIVTNRENSFANYPIQDGGSFPAISFLRNGLFTMKEGSANIKVIRIDSSLPNLHQQNRDHHLTE